jgi:adenylate cyclase
MPLDEDPSFSQGPESAPPSSDTVRTAVGQIVASPDFAASDRARRFLRYVVEETLCGRADRIKAFSVAVEVFGRDETFDPQNDPVVRIEAGRLRRALEHYYLLSGKDDPVVIEIPKGGYVPTFTARSPAPGIAPPPAAAPEPAPAIPVPPRTRAPWIALAAMVVVAIAGLAAWFALGSPGYNAAGVRPIPAGPQILVLPFTDLGDGEVSALYSAALTDEVVTALGRFKEIAVLGVQTSRSLPPDPDLAGLSDLGVQYMLEGSVRANADTVRVSVRVTSSETGAVLWSRTYENAVDPNDLFALPAKTAGEVAAAVAQPYGIVFQAETEREPQAPPDNLDAYLCTLSYYVYRAAITPEGYAQVKACLVQAVERFPEYATAWALLAHIYIDEIRTGFAAGEEPPAERALAAARTAVRLDSENVRALQALATALFFDHKLDEAFKVGDRALALNPNDTELLGQIGQLKGLAGRTEEGRALLEQALARNPGHSGFYRGVLATIAYMQGDYATALREIEQADMRRLPIFHAVAAIIYAQNGMIDRGKAALGVFEEMAPGFVPNLWAELDKRNIPYDAQLRMVEGLEMLGVTPPPRPERGALETAGSG